jgi:DNA-binding NarL/FixJ family response regulator
VSGVRRRSIALVEDSEDDAEMFVEAANRAAPDVEVVRFATASALYRSLDEAESAPSLVITDARLPDASATDVVEHLAGRRGACWTPVVVMSGLADPRVVQECYANGAVGFVLKPSGFGELCEVVEVLCRYWIGAVELPGDPG